MKGTSPVQSVDRKVSRSKSISRSGLAEVSDCWERPRTEEVRVQSQRMSKKQAESNSEVNNGKKGSKARVRK
ncbi:hypothetical protein XELAEV_18020698mg [Xenopus laevis]|uniref:Uncharacterized protein n=1 Tax=Xenopus laevis TaxID=8355 RepID=A0A974D885_XENLA|nr:hypothetical protein XELAEV_18020698mg [Xenopus laevis]